MAIKKLLTAYLLSFMLLVILSGCATLSQKEHVLALVDGEAITETDLAYSLNIEHRREDLSSGSEVDLYGYIQKLINDNLIIQEAYRMRLHQEPAIQKKVQKHILLESVKKLHDEEILQKISVSEQEILDSFRKDYLNYSLGLIEVSSEEEANGIYEKLKAGADFRELAREYSLHDSGKKGGDVEFRQRVLSMSPFFEKAVLSLKTGEISNVSNIAGKYYIVKLYSRDEASDEEFKNFRGSIEKELRKKREQERSEAYLKILRVKAHVTIDQNLLSSLQETSEIEELKRFMEDERPVVRVYDSTLTVKDLLRMVKNKTEEINEETLSGWINLKLVDYEALRRQYEEDDNLKGKVERYEKQLLKRAFVNRAIVPGVTISEDVLKDYYERHQDAFLKSLHYRVQIISVNTMGEAEKILTSLRSGADFSWLAKKKSKDAFAEKGGDMGWHRKKGLPGPVGEIIDELEIAEISEVIKFNPSLYLIVKLLDKTGGGVKEFDSVRREVYRGYMNEQVKILYDEYLAQLRSEAEIRIYDGAVRKLAEKLRVSTP